jgi:hypothetical protein
VAPKSLPHKISVPGLSALFGSRETEKPEEKPPALGLVPPPPVKVTPPPGEGSLPAVVEPRPAPEPAAAPPAPAAVPPSESLGARTPAPRKMSKAVRVTQPEVPGKPKGRHTLVIDEMVLEDLGLLAWAENMSVSAIAREAFDAYLRSRQKALGQARELRDSFGRKREAI